MGGFWATIKDRDWWVDIRALGSLPTEEAVCFNKIPFSSQSSDFNVVQIILQGVRKQESD